MTTSTQTLPELAITVDRTMVVACAIASQDFEDIHHDPGAAVDRGMPDIFMTINATNGFVDRYVTDWAGPASRIRSVSLRLGAPCFPGDVLTMRGEVVDETAESDDVTVQVLGTTSHGTHVTARVVLTKEVRA